MRKLKNCIFAAQYEYLTIMAEPLQITHNDTFLRRFHTKERVMSLTPEDVATLRQAAEQGDAYARYGLGRWLYYRNPDDNAMREAEQLFLDLQDEIPDALAAYALMLRFGETKENRMDIGESQQLLQRAIHRGSELADLLLHKEELERYWQPLFKEMLGDMEDPMDLEPLEDPKTPIDPTVIVIWPTGHLELMEADVYTMKTYREMGQDLIGADNLDAIHHTPLLHLIGEAAGLDLPLVMLCDREAYAKELPDNATGALLYGHDCEVRGPIIICQRDPAGDCHSFKTWEDLTNTYSEIRKHCGNLIIVKDEEDGKFDAWA